MLAVRTVNDHDRWACGARAHAHRAVAGPGPETGQDCSDISRTVPELLTRFGSDVGELAHTQFITAMLIALAVPARGCRVCWPAGRPRSRH